MTWKGKIMSNPGRPEIFVAGFGTGADLVRRLAVSRDGIAGDVIYTDRRSCVISIDDGQSVDMRAPCCVKGLFELLGSAAVVFMISDCKECIRTSRLATRIAEESGVAVMVFMIEDEDGQLEMPDDLGLHNCDHEWICERSSVVVVDVPSDLDDELRLAKMIVCISKMLLEPSTINLDLADLRTVMRCGTEACIISGTGRSPELALQDALDKSLSLMAPSRVRGCLLHITGGLNLTLRDANLIAESMTGALDQHANIIWGMRVRDELDVIEITAVLTGKNIKLQSSRRSSEKRACSWRV
ncbi:MAG: hypothetical protein H5T42_08600 [Methanothrix sp.]|jgi:hypothetical protein|nr:MULTISPECIES: hypothetical protein [Methanothrix]MBC7080505.1 hypothetical protein [Methanothrix sp.]NPU86995.1 hypothetical protein [Methanothrix sp.]